MDSDGFVWRINVSTGEVTTVVDEASASYRRVYASDDCTGTEYIGDMLLAPRFTFGEPFENNVILSRIDSAQAVYRTVCSRLNATGCESLAPACESRRTVLFAEVVPVPPLVVPIEPFSAPIHPEISP